MSTPGGLSQTDDPILVAMVLGGNREAFAAIYDRYADRIHDFGYSLLRSGAAAADLTSVTFTQAARRIQQLGDNRPLYPWLYNIARREAMSRLNGHTRPAMPDDLDPATTIIPRLISDTGQQPPVAFAPGATKSELTSPTTVLTGPTSVIPYEPPQSELDSLEFVAPPSGAEAGSVATETQTETAESETADAPDSPGEPEDREAATLQAMLRNEAAQRAQIWHAVTELPDADRVLLDLHLRHSLEGAALGQATGTPPDEAYVRLNRIRVDAGRPLGAWLLAADAKSSDLTPCPELALLLRGWDGGYTSVIRKKVVRHIDTCQLCQTRHSDLPSPWALYASVPPVLAPPILRGTVLARAEYAAFADQEPKRRTLRLRPFAVPIAAAAVIAVAAAATVLLWPDDSDDRTSNTAGTQTAEPTGDEDLPDPLFLMPPPRTPGAPPPAILPGNGAPASGQSGGQTGAAVPGPAGPAENPGPPPPPPGDTTAPTVGEPRLDSPVQLANIPIRVSAPVTDASPVTSATLHYVDPGAGPTSRPMSRDGDTWVTWIGPYCAEGIVPAYVTATDSAGNTATGPTAAMGYVIANC